MRHAVPTPAVQLITGEWRDLPDLQSRVRAALRGGLRWVQLRAKASSANELYEAAAALAPMLREAGALFVINDRVDIALAVGAGGVHLPENGMSPRDARRLLGEDAWIARSVHAPDALHSPAELDAIQFGPVFETASKRAFGPPQGLQALSDAVRSASGTPVIAVGGITSQRMSSCLGTGAAAVSVIGAVWDASDVADAAAAFAR